MMWTPLVMARAGREFSNCLAAGPPLRLGLRVMSHREEIMPTFLCFLNWTDQGAKNAKDAVKRYQASKAMAEKLGGRLLSAYVTTGYYDVVITVEMPNGETMTKYTTAISATGNARTTTVRGYSPEEFSKLAAEAPSM